MDVTVREAGLEDGPALARIVANVWVYRVPKVPRPHPEPAAYGYVTNVYTDPGHRDAKVGTAVLQRVVEWGREQGLEGLYVSPSERSVPFYERAGFTWSEEWMEQKHE